MHLKQLDRLPDQRAIARSNVFAGNPSHDEIPDWPAYTLDRRATISINSGCNVVNDSYPEERLVWKSLT